LYSEASCYSGRDSLWIKNYRSVLIILYVVTDTFGGNVGLAISQSLILNGMLQYGMRLAAEVVSQMTSVERILEYTKVEKETDLEKHPGKCTSFLTC
jgi:hypothetical protein